MTGLPLDGISIAALGASSCNADDASFNEVVHGSHHRQERLRTPSKPGRYTSELSLAPACPTNLVALCPGPPITPIVNVKIKNVGPRSRDLVLGTRRGRGGAQIEVGCYNA